MKTFRITKPTPAQRKSRSLIVLALWAREDLNAAIRDHGAASAAARCAARAYRELRVETTVAMRAAGQIPAPRRAMRFASLPDTGAGLTSAPAPEIRTEADWCTIGRRLGLVGSDLDMYIYMNTRRDSQLATILLQTALAN